MENDNGKFEIFSDKNNPEEKPEPKGVFSRERAAAEESLKELQRVQAETDTEDLEKVRQELVLINRQPDFRAGKEQADYIARYSPDYLKTRPSFVYKLAHFFGKFQVDEVRGKEHLPQEAKLFIANHRGGETPKLIGALDEPVHITSGQTINWNRSGLVVWLMKKMGMVPIQESFSHLSAEQQESVVAKARPSQKESHREIVDKQNQVDASNIKNIRAMAALLLQGENVALFAEGAFSRLTDDDRRAYAGHALVAREYKRISGRDLSIIPTAIRDKKVAFGEYFLIDQTGRESKEELESIATEKIHNLYDTLE